MKDDEMPDYSPYSLHQLQNIATHINRERFPDHYEAVRQAIEQCEPEMQVQTVKSEIEQKAAWSGFHFGLVSGFVLIGFGLLAPNVAYIDGIQPDKVDYILVILFGAVGGVVSGLIMRWLTTRWLSRSPECRVFCTAAPHPVKLDG